MFSLLAFLIGGVVSLQSRVASELTHHVHNGITAGTASNLFGWLVLWILVFGIKRERTGFFHVLSALRSGRLKIWEVIGGIGGGLFISVQSTQVPVIGVALFSITYIAGQTICSIIVDEFGIAPGGKKPITFLRVITSSITLVGVFVAVFPNFSHSTFKLLPFILVAFVGGVTPFQQALNARVNVVSTRPLATAWFNFACGSAMILTILAIDLLTGHEFGSLPSAPSQLWMYFGGPLGVIFIATTAYILKHLGVLKWGLLGVAGQLLGALLIDWIAPTQQNGINNYLLAGSAITFGAIAGARYFESRATKKI